MKMMNETHVNNHYVPSLHLRKWTSQGGKVFVKKDQESRNIENTDFSQKYYYWIDGSNELEKRIGRFESYIGNIIIMIDKSNDSVNLNAKQLFLLKLYSLLCTYRQENTTEIIKSDFFGMYEGNQYRFGSKNLTSKEEVILETEKVITLFEIVHKMKKFNVEAINDNEIYTNLSMLHLSIIRSNEIEFMISDVFTIIENTLDNEHLYAYTPVSPRSAILLVQTLYYKDFETLKLHKNRLNFLRGKMRPDPYLSTIFCRQLPENNYSEVDLICSYNLNSNSMDTFSLRVNHVLEEVAIYLNSILFQDSNKIVYLKNESLKLAKSIRAEFRDITPGLSNF
jgi:hypothetical protein